jgi:hypothetical protein
MRPKEADTLRLLLPKRRSLDPGGRRRGLKQVRGLAAPLQRSARHGTAPESLSVLIQTPSLGTPSDCIEDRERKGCAARLSSTSHSVHTAAAAQSAPGRIWALTAQTVACIPSGSAAATYNRRVIVVGAPHRHARHPAALAPPIKDQQQLSRRHRNHGADGGLRCQWSLWAVTSCSLRSVAPTVSCVQTSLCKLAPSSLLVSW